MIADTIPEFSRGATFEARFSLPESVEPSYFLDWTPLSQIRKTGVITESGLIADLLFSWVAPGESRAFILTNNDTEEWPLGSASLDVVFISDDGIRRRTKTFEVNIIAGPTQV